MKDIVKSILLLKGNRDVWTAYNLEYDGEAEGSSPEEAVSALMTNLDEEYGDGIPRDYSNIYDNFTKF